MDEPAATDDEVSFRLVVRIGPVRPTVSRLRLIAQIVAAIGSAIAPWRRLDDPRISFDVESDVSEKPL